MTDFVSDGQPFETPMDAAAEGYAATPSSWGAAIGQMFQGSARVEGPITEPLSVQGEFARELGATTMVDPLAGPVIGAAPAPQVPILSADQVNERYAPIGPDGKPVPITTEPLPEDVAQMAGKAKADAMERDGVIARFENAHSWPVNFLMHTAAFLMDPLNLATAFVPGIGEDAILGGLGRAGFTGFAARTLARTAAGAAGAAVAQAPLAALQLGPENGDYALRDALRDVMLSAAGGAVAQAGFGAIGDLLPRRAGIAAGAAAEAPGAGAPSTAATIATADATTKADAMRAAVAQIADGREVNVEPVFAAASPRGPARPEDINQFLASSGGLVDQGGELRAIGADQEVIPFRGRLVTESGATLDYAREAAEEAGYLPQGSSIADLLDAVDNTMRGNPVFADRDLSDATAWREWRGARGRGPDEPFDPFDPNTMFADVADQQQRLYRDGYAAGTPQDEFDGEREAIYGDGARDRLEIEAAPPQGAGAGTETDRAIAEAERELAGGEVYPEDLAEIAQTRGGIEAAKAHSAAYQEAAGCLAAAV